MKLMNAGIGVLLAVLVLMILGMESVILGLATTSLALMVTGAVLAKRNAQRTQRPQGKAE